MIVKIFIMAVFILLFACSIDIDSSDYPEEVTNDMYKLCLVTYRYGYCKCYVENWQKNIPYDRHPEILELLQDIDKNCKRLPTSEQGW